MFVYYWSFGTGSCYEVLEIANSLCFGNQVLSILIAEDKGNNSSLKKKKNYLYFIALLSSELHLKFLVFPVLKKRVLILQETLSVGGILKINT